MTKEHKKLYKAGKNWVAATITVATIAFIGSTGTVLSAHADTTVNDSPQTQQVVDSSAADQNTRQTVQTSLNQETQQSQNAVASSTQESINTDQSNINSSKLVSSSQSNGLDPNIYGTVNVKDWDYQENNHIFNLTNYHGDVRDIIIPNLNDFSKAGKVNNDTIIGVGISSNLVKNLVSQGSSLAISKTNGIYNAKVTAVDNNWSKVFGSTVLHNLDLTNLDTHNITDMSGLFEESIELETVGDLSNWDTSNVTDMSGMFSKMASLKSVGNLNNWDTGNVTNMSNMFSNAQGLEDIGNLNNWNTSKVTNMANMFFHTLSLKNIGDLSKWNTKNVTDFTCMFAMSNIQAVGNLGDWDTNHITNMSYMFEDTEFKTVGDLSHWDTGNVTDMKGMFNESNIQAVGDLSNWNTHNVTDMSYAFADYNLRTVGDLSHWNTSNVTNMSHMFNGIKVQNLGNLNDWDTHNVTNMSDMFSGAVNLKKLSISNWDTGKVTDMSNMFRYATSLKTLDLSHWNTSNVVNMHSMFEEASNLQSIGNISNWNTDSAVDDRPREYALSNMFNGTTLPYFSVSSGQRYDTHYYRNKVQLVDPNGLMGQPDRTVAIINVPTFYKQVSGKTKEESVIATITPLVEREANKIYQQFRNNLTKGMQIIYPEKVSLKIKYFSYNPTNLANATFYYDMKIGTLKRVFLNYVDKDGNIVGSEVLTGRIGSTIPLPKQLSLPDGYQLVKGQDIPTSVTVKPGKVQTIDIYVEDGSISPAIKKGTINYVDPDGNVIKTDKLTGKVGDQVNIKVSLPDGYELADKDEQIPETVTVTDDGIKTITIKIKKIPEAKTGKIIYIDPDGKTVKTDELTGKVGDQIDVKVALPDGYELADKNEQIPKTVTVTKDGIKDITIHVKKIPEAKTGTINYVDPDGNIVKTDQISGKVGDQIEVKLSLPAGYELVNSDEQIPKTVTVTDDGIKTITIQVKKVNTNLADNEVPYDFTTINNNENANYGHLDHYQLTENSKGQAQLGVSGWQATGSSNQNRYRYLIVYDDTLGHEIARQKVVPVTRADVQKAYPNVTNSLYSGFNATINIPNSAVSHTLRLISRYSSDPNSGEMNRVDYWYDPVAANMANNAYLDNLSSNGSILTVSGWHATNQAAERPYHYIIAWDQRLGHEIARQQVTTVSRPDVAKAYPGIFNAINSGFKVGFTLTPEFFNDNIQFISRWTNDPNGNGSAVDYWFSAINRANRACLDSVNLSSGRLQVAGWHATDLSQLEPNHYLIVVDNTTGQQVVSEKVNLNDSADIQRVFNDIHTANHSRFNFTFGPLNLIAGHNYSLVSRYSADSNGNGNDGTHTDYWLNMGAFNQAAHSIDQCFVRGNELTVSGWMINDRAMMDKPYAYVILLQNGHEIGRQRVSLSTRDDVARVYPRTYNSRLSGFNAHITLPQYSLSGLQAVLRFTDDPAGNGNSADEWVGINPVRVY